MIVLMQGESLRIPATVVGSKALITGISAEIKKSSRGEVPAEGAPVVASLAVSDFSSEEIIDGLMFELTNTSALTLGIYFVNFSYTVDGRTYKGSPMKVVVKESVI